MTWLRLVSRNSVVEVREKLSRPLAISEARKLCWVIFSRTGPKRGSVRICLESICAYEEMTASGVLISCATPRGEQADGTQLVGLES